MLEVEKIAGWVKKLRGAGLVKQFWGGSKIEGGMTNCRVGGICREDGKWWVQKSGGLKLWLILWELWKYFFGKKSQTLHVN